MYLKSLTLKGFKSFAKPTTFAFEPGVTCVVGPNGSGKSNVVDALAWVMGEQGAKTLRGGKMEDVIFAGTATTGPLGRAEVVLTIDNSDGALPIEYTEVTIKRTMFRGGGSDYAINGRSCRLLDVQELLSDSGLGREMHVIVGQGQLDAVLRATPEERRGFVEEAAGILKHRRRKEKTVRKLEAMEANLTRLSDLAGEIRRQLKPLGRQAEVAKEAQTIAAVVRDARARILADDVVQLRSAITVHSRTESESTTERIVLQEQLDQARLRVARLEQAQVSDEVDRARTTAFELQSVQEKLRSLFALAGQQLALLGQQHEVQDVQAGVSETEVIDAVEEAQRLAESIAAAEDYWRQAQTVTAGARTALTALDDEIAQQSALVSRHDLELSQLEGLYDSAVTRLAAIRAEAERQKTARDAARERCATAERALAEAEAAAPDEQHNTAQVEQSYRDARELVSSIEAEIDPLRSAVHAVERERDALAARKSALSSALDQRDGSTAVATSGLDGIQGLVADSVRVTNGWEAAIAAALGAIANAVLAEGRDAALAALGHAAAHNVGRVDVVVADAASGHMAPVFDHLPPGVVPAHTVVTAPEGIIGLLEHVVLAEDTSGAQQAWAILSEDGRRRTTIITRAGEVLSHFVLRGGSGAARSKLELAADRDAAATRLTQVTAEIHRARTALEQRVEALREAKVRAAEALTEVREYDSAAAQRTQKLNRARVQVEATQGEAHRLERALAVTEQAVAEAVTAVSRATAAREEAQARPRPILDVTARDQVSAELDLAREREVEARLAVDTARERMRGQQLRAEQLRLQREREQAAAEEAARRAVIRRRHQEAAERVLAALPHALEVADASAAEANSALTVAERERSAQNTELIQLRRDEHTVREKLQQVTESVHGLEMQIYEKKLHLSGLLERAGAELGLVEDVLVAEYGPDQPTGEDAEPFVRAEQEHRLARAERTLAQLGRINPLALEEFAALEQRHTFLTEQLTDLTTTRADLLTIVDEIDEKMQGIFADAFADTRTAFNEVFPVLFPGGSGSIHLTDPDSMLTTGIEVSVKPAGKKIERLSLLSGGERSLAAVALLIAIFKARPSPFYIMDEVEAALDDANLGRLLHIFEDLRDTSQLIIITHQKRTMEIADALYGVSMRQDGVSAVVGQRVSAERAETARAQAPAPEAAEAYGAKPPAPEEAPAPEAAAAKPPAAETT